MWAWLLGGCGFYVGVRFKIQELLPFQHSFNTVDRNLPWFTQRDRDKIDKQNRKVSTTDESPSTAPTWTHGASRVTFLLTLTNNE